MQIDIKGRNVPVSDNFRRHAERRLGKVSRQVSPLARLELEIFAERNPRVADSQVTEATLYLKGITLRARDASPDMLHSLNLVVDSPGAIAGTSSLNYPLIYGGAGAALVIVLAASLLIRGRRRRDRFGSFNPGTTFS